MDFMEEMRQNAAAYDEKQVDLQSIWFRQGREIAETYVDMMKGCARLNAQSGRYDLDGDRKVVKGFCRIEEAHFGKPLLKRTKKQSFWTAQWSETVTLRTEKNDLYAAFCTSFADFCRQNHIRIGELRALLRTKDGTLMEREFPLTVTSPEYLEAIGFPYIIAF